MTSFSPIISQGATALRAADPADIPFLQQLRNDFALQTQLLSLPRANSPGGVRDWLDGLAKNEQSVFFVIYAIKDGSPVGFIQLGEINFIHRRGCLGICVGPDARGRGHGAAAIAMMEAYCARIFGLRKLVLQVLATNKGAIHLYKRLGYTRVGVYSEHFYHGGTFHDVAIMEHLLPARQAS